MSKEVEIELVPNTQQLEALTTAIIDLLYALKTDFERFRTTLEQLGE